MGIDGRGYPLAEESSALTDSAGNFQIDGLPQGFAQLWISDQRYHQIGINELYSVGKLDQQPIEIRVDRTGTVHISVLDKNGKPLARFDGGAVHLEIESTAGRKVGSWGGSANVNTNGIFDFKGVPPGEYKITTRPNPGSSTKEYAPLQIITVESGKTIDVKMIYP